MNVDPAASVQVWAIEIDLGGRTFTVPALPASTWLPILLDGNPLLVLDLIESTPGDDDVDNLLLSGELPPEELVEALTVAIEQAAGREFHVAFVLAQVAKMQWSSVSGLLSERGFRWDQAPLGAALDAVYAIVAKHLDKESSEKFHRLLDTPLSLSNGRRGRADRTRAMSDFEAMAGPRPAPVPATGARSGGARPRSQPRPQPRHQGAR